MNRCLLALLLLLPLLSVAGSGNGHSRAAPKSTPAAESATPAPAATDAAVAPVPTEPRLPKLRLTYGASWKGIGLGEIVIVLKPDEAPNCYRYTSKSDPVGLVKMFYGSPREVSLFCVRDGKVVPGKFSFISTKGDEEDFSLTFDMKAGTVTDENGEVRKVPADVQDRFGIQQAVRLWLLGQLGKKDPGTAAFSMVDANRVRRYEFAITSYQKIKVPAGEFETILVQRVDKSSRSSKFWIAPARDHMPVKVQTLKDGDVILSMELRKSGDDTDGD